MMLKLPICDICAMASYALMRTYFCPITISESFNFRIYNIQISFSLVVSNVFVCIAKTTGQNNVYSDHWPQPAEPPEPEARINVYSDHWPEPPEPPEFVARITFILATGLSLLSLLGVPGNLRIPRARSALRASASISADAKMLKIEI